MNWKLLALKYKEEGGYPEPTGTISIVSNGSHNVKDYAEANVNVPTPTPDLEDITITQNGVYNHPNKDGYDEVTVNVPNTYTSSDEGKVVNNGALASQTSTTKTANGTYDTTLNNEVVVNVPTPAPDLEDITITQNGTYESSQHDGYGEVTVNVSGGSTPDYYIEYIKTGNDITSINCHHISPNNIAYNMSTVTSATFTNDITTIGQYAFSGCTGLTNITLPSPLTTIEQCAFSGCTGLTNITLPSSLTTIEQHAFLGCTGLTSLNLSNVSQIRSYAFSGCTGLTQIVFPLDSTINEKAFRNCTSLQSIDFTNSNLKFYLAGTSSDYNETFNGCSALTSVTGTNCNIKINYGDIFKGCPLTNVNLQGNEFWVYGSSSQYTGYGRVFTADSLKEVTLNFKRYVMGSTQNAQRVFNSTGLEKVYLLDGKSGGTSLLHSQLFYNCSNLTDIYVGWSEGEVANAPWGATNATIHYDYVPS